MNISNNTNKKLDYLPIGSLRYINYLYKYFNI